MKKKISLKEIVVLAMIAALMGVVFTGIDAIYEPLKALTGPFGGAIIYGAYLISALLSMYLVRKPGAGLIGSLFTGIVNPHTIKSLLANIYFGLGLFAT
jgi:energy-coupling factor transport system substrate-specific component